MNFVSDGTRRDSRTLVIKERRPSIISKIMFVSFCYSSSLAAVIILCIEKYLNEHT